MNDTITFRPGDLTIPSQNRSAFVRDAVRFYLAILDNPHVAACVLTDRLHTRDSALWVDTFNRVLPLCQTIQEALK